MDLWRRTNWKIASLSRLWFMISAALIALSIFGWAARGLNYGIDFTGGTLHKFSMERGLGPGQPGAVQLTAQVRSILDNIGVTQAQIQAAPPNMLLIRTPTQQGAGAAQQGLVEQENQQVLQALNEALADQMGRFSPEGADYVGAVVSGELIRNAIWALILGNLLIFIFVTARYEYRVAAACIVALLHDVIVMVGAMALLRVEVNSEFVAAILTIIGYSVNDSVVIFDRIRENRRLHRSADLETVANASLLQTLNRSINTSLSVLFPLLALYFLGGATLRPFSLALLIGMTLGTYSSIFVAGPLVAAWDRVARKRRGAAAQMRSRAPLTVAGSAGGSEAAGRRPEEQPAARSGPSAEQALRRAQTEAQEEKRDARRERRKTKSGDRGKRRH